MSHKVYFPWVFGGTIKVLEIPQADYKDMIDFSAETKTDLSLVQKMIAVNEHL